MEFRVLGLVEVARDHGPVSLGGRQRRLLLALLLSRSPDGYPSEQLIQALWEDDPPPAATTVLHAQISRLRGRLEPNRRPRQPPTVLVSTNDGYRLDIRGHDVDARRFEDLVREARAMDVAAADEAKRLLSEALALWRGPAYGDLASHAVLATAASRLEEQRLRTVEELTEVRLRLGEHAELVSELESAVRAHPFRERAWGQLMLALYRCGRQADALAVYQRCRRQLGDELGIDPSPDLQAFEQAILRQSKELAWRPTAAEPATPTITAHETATFVHVAPPDAGPADEDVRRLVDELGGQLFRGAAEGQAMLARFASPAGAVGAAAALARRLAGPTTQGIAVHSGRAVRLGADWFGPAVDYVSSLGSIAQGGQVLVSDATAELVGDQVPAEASMRDLGMHRFREWAAIERVHQLCQPGLPDAFPPLRTRPELIGLPTEVSSFVGRQAELSEVSARLAHTRLVTLTGPGGTGKTRLAVRVARRALDLCPDGALFVDLAQLDEPERLVDFVARPLRLDSGAAIGAIDAVVGFLRDRRMLLVLDNCEHLVDAVSELALSVLEASDSRILTTSRERLGILAEETWLVPTLTLPDTAGPDAVGTSEAVRLFCERAAAVAPTFQLTEANAADIATICRRLDGLPLAIELAAARTRVMSVAEIAARLDNRFALLGAPTRTSAARHRTLRAVVEWSYRQLGEDARRLLAAVSVFPGSFALGAAEAVGGDRTLDLLTELIDKSLVQVVPGEDVRYRLLETIRAFALERLDDEDARAAVEAAHARHFLDQAEQIAGGIRGFDDLACLRRLDADYENIRLALHWGITNGVEQTLKVCWPFLEYWGEKAHAQDAARITDAALEAFPSGTGRIPALWLAAHVAAVSNATDRAADLAEQAIDLARVTGDRPAEGRALILACHVGWYANSFDAGLDYWREFQRVGDVALPSIRAEGAIFAGRIHLERGELETGMRLVSDGTALARSLGARYATAFGLRVSGLRRALEGDYDAAVRDLDAALELVAEAGYSRQAVWCQRALALAAWRQGELERAREIAEQALNLAIDCHGGYQVAAMQLTLAASDRAAGDVESALERLSSLRRRGESAWVGLSWFLSGEIELHRANPQDALRAFESAMAIGADADRAGAGIGAAAARLALRRSVRTEDVFDACERLRSSASYDACGWYRYLAGHVLARIGCRPEAKAMLAAALEECELTYDLLTPVRVAEQVAHLAGTAAPSTAAEVLLASTALRESVGLSRTALEGEWYAEARGSAGDADPPRAELAGRDQLLSSARALLEST